MARTPLARVVVRFVVQLVVQQIHNKVSPRGRRDDMPPADGSSVQKSRRIYVRPRTGRSPHISAGRRWLSCRQPACLQPRQLRHGTDKRTDRAIPKCLLGRGHSKSSTNPQQIEVIECGRPYGNQYLARAAAVATVDHVSIVRVREPETCSQTAR